jgi:hypothetical protein
MLDEHFQTTLDGLYITGYSTTRDFVPWADSGRNRHRSASQW